MSFTPSWRSLTWRMNVLTPPPCAWMPSSISMTAWLAPPCSGPNSALMPAETDANRFACDEPTSRTVDVEQFCSWSACRRRSWLSAFDRTGLTSYGSAGTPKVIRRKLSMKPRELSG